MNKHSHIIHSKQNNMYCCWNCFFQPKNLWFKPQNCHQPQKTVFCLVPFKLDSELLSKFQEGFFVNFQLEQPLSHLRPSKTNKNLGPEATELLMDPLMVVDGEMLSNFFPWEKLEKSDLWMTSS